MITIVFVYRKVHLRQDIDLACFPFLIFSILYARFWNHVTACTSIDASIVDWSGLNGWFTPPVVIVHSTEINGAVHGIWDIDCVTLAIG